MPEIRKHLCLVALGANRDRLAADLVDAIVQRGCNISDCRIMPLGTRFSALLMLSGNWSAMAKMETALPGLAEELDLAIEYQHGHPNNNTGNFRPYSAEIIAPQQPRLLGVLLDFFNSQDVHVIEVSAQDYDSGLTGAHMCTVHLALHVPLSHHPQLLRDSFMDLCDELQADGLLDPIKT